MQPEAFAAAGPARQHLSAPAPASSSPPQQHTYLLPLLAGCAASIFKQDAPAAATFFDDACSATTWACNCRQLCTACHIPSTLQEIIIYNSKSVVGAEGILKDCSMRVMLRAHVACFIYPDSKNTFCTFPDTLHLVTKSGWTLSLMEAWNSHKSSSKFAGLLGIASRLLLQTGILSGSLGCQSMPITQHTSASTVISDQQPLVPRPCSCNFGLT